MNQLAIGVPLRPSTPQPSGCASGISPLPLKVVSTGRRGSSASAMTAGMSSRAPWPTMITGRSRTRRSSAVCTRSSASAGGRSLAQAMRPSGPRPGRSRCVGQGLDLVGEDQVRHAAVQDRALARQVHELGVLRRVQHGLAPLGNLSRMRPVQIDLLESARAEHLHVDLSGECQQRARDQPSHPRGPVIRFVAPGPAIRQAGRRLAPSASRTPEQANDGGTFVSYSVVVEACLSDSSLSTKRVRKTEVRMPDHAEVRR